MLQIQKVFQIEFFFLYVSADHLDLFVVQIDSFMHFDQYIFARHIADIDFQLISSIKLFLRDHYYQIHNLLSMNGFCISSVINTDKVQLCLNSFITKCSTIWIYLLLSIIKCTVL